MRSENETRRKEGKFLKNETRKVLKGGVAQNVTLEKDISLTKNPNEF